jgi:hypothetical protein
MAVERQPKDCKDEGPLAWDSTTAEEESKMLFGGNIIDKL